MTFAGSRWSPVAERMMSFQLGNRDQNGVLVGSFDQGRRAFPIDILRHIVPFLYPCQECQALKFHVMGEQHAGIGFKIPFMRKPLASTGKVHQAICNTCTNINTVIPDDAFRKLEQGIIPTQISAMYAVVCDPPEPYTDGFAENFLGRHPEAGDKTIAFVRKCLVAYRRES